MPDGNRARRGCASRRTLFYESEMVIEKVINNNVISSRDSDHNEIIVMGRGIGFQRKPGQQVAESDVEKIFRLESRDVREKFKDLLAAMPMEYIQVCADIISYARNRLSTRLSQNVYLTLTDHVAFAIGRLKDGMDFSNTLYREIKRFYPLEFEIGMYAIALIEERIGVRLPDDEAASIAIHLMDAEFDIKVRDAWSMTQMMQEITQILEQEYGLPSEDSLHRDRLMSNLKFLTYRLLTRVPADSEADGLLCDFVKTHYPEEYAAARRVKDYVGERCECGMPEEEVTDLALQLRRSGAGKKAGGV